MATKGNGKKKPGEHLTSDRHILQQILTTVTKIERIVEGHFTAGLGAKVAKLDTATGKLEKAIEANKDTDSKKN